MSAWAEIVNSDGSDEWLEKCNSALKEVQQETRRKALREAAEKQRQFRDEQYWPLEFKAEKRALNGAIDLIDPEVRS